MPHGTHAQQNVFRAVQRAGRVASTAALPLRGAKRLRPSCAIAASAAERQTEPCPVPSTSTRSSATRPSASAASSRRRAAWPRPAYPAASVISPSDPSEHALEAFAQVVGNLGWNHEADRIVFAHTHQPLACVRSSQDSRTRYWNTGSWIYEPDLGSRQAYARYLRHAWPGTAIVIDDEEPEPRLVELLADLNPLTGGAGMPASQ